MVTLMSQVAQLSEDVEQLNILFLT